MAAAVGLTKLRNCNRFFFFCVGSAALRLRIRQKNITVAAVCSLLAAVRSPTPNSSGSFAHRSGGALPHTFLPLGSPAAMQPQYALLFILFPSD